jgi:hypothetical protein
MANKTVGFELKFEGFTELLKLNDELKEQKKILAELRKSQGANSEAYLKQAESVGKLQAEIKQKKLEQSKEIQEQRKASKESAKAAKLANEEVGAYKKKSQQLNKLIKEYQDLAASEEDTTEETKDLLLQIQKLDAELKNIDTSVGRSQRKVGEYENAVKGLGELMAGNITRSFQQTSKQLEDISSSLGDLGNGMGTAINVSQKFNNTLKVISKNPLLFALAAIVGILVKLGEAFGKSEKGSKLFAKGAAVIEGVMNAIVTVSIQVFEWFEKIFKDNQKEVSAFGSFIQDEILNRVYGLIDGFVGLGKVIASIFKGDLQEAKKAANEAGESFKNMFTGEENLEGVKGKVNELTETVKANTSATLALEQIKRGAAATNRALTKSLQELLTQEELNNAIADDSTKSFKERETAAEAARVATLQRAEIEIKIAKNNARLINSEISLRKQQGLAYSDLLDQQTDSFVAIKEAERGLTLAIRDNEKTRSELTQDRLERDLDFLIDNFDKIKTVNEQIISDDELSFEQRQSLLNQTTQEFDKTYSEQTKIIESFAGKQLDINSLITESDSKIVAEKVRSFGLSEIIEGRLLEIITDRRQGLQDLAVTQKELTESKKENDLEQLQSEQQLQEQLNEIKFKKGLINESEYAEQSIQIQIDALQKKLELGQLETVEKNKVLNELALLELEMQKTSYDNSLKELDKQLQKEKSLLLKSLNDDEIKEKEYKDRLIELENEFNEKKIEKRYEGAELGLEIIEDVAEQEIQLNRSKNEQIEKDDEDSAKKRLDLASNLATESLDTIGSIFAAQQAKETAVFDEKQMQQTESLDNRLEQDLAKYEGNEEKQAEITEKYNEDKKSLDEKLALEKEEIERKFAKKQQRLAIANAIINGAVGIVKTGSNLGYPLAIPFQIAQGIQTVAQIAAINAQQFAEGGKVGASNIPMLPNGDSVLATLMPDEVVLTKANQKALGGDETFRQIGVKGFGSPRSVSGPSVSPRINTSFATQSNVNQQSNGLILRSIAATNNRIDRIKVVANAKDIVKMGNEKNEKAKKLEI